MATQEIDRDKDSRMTATKVIEQYEAGIKRYADKFELIKPDLDNEATRKWLRDCEKEIAKAMSVSDEG